jgi:hypothetical protein
MSGQNSSVWLPPKLLLNIPVSSSRRFTLSLAIGCTLPNAYAGPTNKIELSFLTDSRGVPLRTLNRFLLRRE